MKTDYKSLTEEELESLRQGTLGQEVAVSEIEHSLRQLWEGDEARTRASLVNFAIYSEQKGSLIENSDLLAKVTQEHACRGLLIMALPGSPDFVRAWITAHCHLSNGRTTVCSEQVALLLQGGRPVTVSNVVFSNLDSDLPLTFWWQGDFSPNFEDRLYSVIDRLIIDSDSWTDPKANFGVLQAAEADSASRFVVSDLAWARSHSFRAALARRFEIPAARAALCQVDRLIIGHGAKGVLQSAFLSAWIAHALGADPREGKNGWVLRRKDAPDIEVIHEDLDSDLIEHIELRGPDCRFRVARCNDHLEGTTVTPVCEDRQLLPGSPRQEAALLTELLARVGGTSLYGQLIPLVRELL